MRGPALSHVAKIVIPSIRVSYSSILNVHENLSRFGRIGKLIKTEGEIRPPPRAHP
jgi:hypothetical protein